MWWMYPLVVGGSYLLGSTPIGLIVGRWCRGVDIRQYGSGKTGFTNSLRTLGLAPSIVVFTGDLLKGAIPVLVATELSPHPALRVLAALAAVLGHIMPVFAGFKGGRGVTTSWGATFVMMPQVALFLLLAAAAIAYAWRYMSLVSVLSTLSGAVLVFALAIAGRVPAAYVFWAIAAPAIIVVTHLDNLRRLRAGTEPKIGHGGTRRTSPGSANL
jgi:acyl phosphate:glycerol-3-phosphate acyltransferase